MKNNKMIKKTIFILCIFLILFIKNSYAEKNNILWEKAIQISEKNSNWIPKKIIESEKVYNAKGELEETSIAEYSYDKDKNNNLKLILEKFIKNGIECTKENQNEFDQKEKIKEFQISQDENPFSKSLNTKRKIIKLKEYKIFNNRKYICYKFKHEIDNVNWKSFALLDFETGIPYKLYTESKDKIKEDSIVINNIKIEIEFNMDAENWYIKKIKTDLQAEVNIFFFIKYPIFVENNILLKNHFKYEK